MIDFEQKLLDLNDNLCDLQIRFDTLKEDYDIATERLSSEMKMGMRYKQEAIRLQQELNKIKDNK